jgi:hypothetical protein
VIGNEPRIMDNKTVDIFPGLFLVGGVADMPELM